MRKKYSKKNLAVGVIVLITCIGLISGCGESESNGDAETGDMEVTPEAQQQDKNTRKSDTAMEDVQTFEVSLDGENQVPEAVDTEASGTATITVRGDSVHVKGAFADLSSEYLASHIHIGGEDENGDPIQPLDPELGEDKTSGTWDDTYQLDEEHLSALQSDSLYINVHSTEFSGGEIRGQLSPTTTRNM